MPDMTISQVAKAFDVSTRTLRYYDSIGLLPSAKRADNSYRVYDEAALQRLRQIVVLKKLRIPLKQIERIVSRREVSEAVRVFLEGAAQIDQELAALRTVRELLLALARRLEASAQTRLPEDAFDDEHMAELAVALHIPQPTLKEEPHMDELNKADQQLNQIHDLRIIHLPPMTVAAARGFGKEPENLAMTMLHQFVIDSDLVHVKPDMRLLGFNNPSEPNENGEYGYEYWVTIPEGMDVPAPMEKKTFAGGMYAGHVIPMGQFEDWRRLMECIWHSDRYAYDAREPRGMEGLLEEHIDPYHAFLTHPGPGVVQFEHLHLLYPVKEK